MINQRIKDIIFYLVGSYSCIAYPFLKLRFNNSNPLYLHIGSGKNRIKEFINIDGNPLADKDLLFDVRLKLPFEESSANIIYTSNTLEHFYIGEALSILREFYRVLNKEGILRIVVPDLGKSVHAYMDKNHDFFSDFPHEFKSIGGRFSNFLFCDGQHKMAFDLDFLKELLVATGFDRSRISRMSFGESLMDSVIYDSINPLEEIFKDNNLFIEAVK